MQAQCFLPVSLQKYRTFLRHIDYMGGAPVWCYAASSSYLHELYCCYIVQLHYELPASVFFQPAKTQACRQSNVRCICYRQVIK